MQPLFVVGGPGLHEQTSDAVLHPRRLSHQQIAVAQYNRAAGSSPAYPGWTAADIG